MKTDEMSFQIFVEGFCLFAMFMLTKVDEVVLPLLYFACGITFTIAYLGVMVFISDLNKRRNAEKDIQ